MTNSGMGAGRRINLCLVTSQCITGEDRSVNEQLSAPKPKQKFGYYCRCSPSVFCCAKLPVTSLRYQLADLSDLSSSLLRSLKMTLLSPPANSAYGNRNHFAEKHSGISEEQVQGWWVKLKHHSNSSEMKPWNAVSITDWWVACEHLRRIFFLPWNNNRQSGTNRQQDKLGGLVWLLVLRRAGQGAADYGGKDFSLS